MKRFLSALLIVFFIASSLAVSAKSVELKLKFTPGQVDVYQVAMDMKMTMPDVSGAPSQPMMTRTSMQLTQKVLKILPDGSARMKTTYSNMKMSSNGKSVVLPAKQMPKTGSFVMEIAPNGSVKSFSGVAKIASSMPGMDADQMIRQIGTSHFPTGPISVGQEWNDNIPMFGGEMSCKSVLEAASTPVGKYTASKIHQTLSGGMDIAKMMPATASSVKGDVVMNGDMVTYFMADRGKMLKSSGTISALMTMTELSGKTDGAQPRVMHMKMDMNISMTKLR